MARTHFRFMKWSPAGIVKATRTEASRRLTKVGEVVANEIIRSASTPTATNGPSLPGQYPHMDTGRFIRSIYYRLTDARRAVEIGAMEQHSVYLEEGTTNADGSQRMAPRPWLLRTVYRVRQRITRILVHGK